MKTNSNVIELTNQELVEVQGGFLELILGGIAVVGAFYGAGYAAGEAYYHYTHPK